MTKYTAQDFANAKFAELTTYGLRAHKSAGDSFWQRDGIKRATDEEMADAGWVPVPDKPTIAAGAAGRHSYLLGPSVESPRVIDYLEALGIKVIPDPEPTNTERLTEMYKDWSCLANPESETFPEYLDRNGVTAPNVKGN